MKKGICLFGLICCLFGLAVAPAAAETAVEVEFQVYLWPNRIAQQMGQRAERAAQLAARSQESGVERNTDPDGAAAWFSYDATGMGDWQSIPLQVGEMTESYRYRGSPELVFYQSAGNARGQQANRPLAQVTLPGQARKFILVLTARPGGTFDVLAVENSETAIPPGHALIYNLTDDFWGMSLGGEPFELGPGVSALRSLTQDSHYYQQVLVASQDQAGKWVRRLARKITVQGSSGLILFLYKDPEQGQQLSLLKLLSQP